LVSEFKDKYHPGVKKDLRKINPSVKSGINRVHITEILRNPCKADELTGDLTGIRSYHFRKEKVQYRISYIVNESQKIVNILMIGKRESFYEILKRCLN